MALSGEATGLIPALPSDDGVTEAYSELSAAVKPEPKRARDEKNNR